MKKSLFDKLIENSVSDALKFIYENSSEEFKRQRMEDELKSRYHANKKAKNPDDDLNEKDEEEGEEDTKPSQNSQKNQNQGKEQKSSNDDQIAKELGIDKEKIAPKADKIPDKLPDDLDSSSGPSKLDNNKVEEPPEVEIPTEEQMMAPTLEFVTSQINDMRSGSSMKDEIVSKNFKTYFDSLSEPEKQMLLIYTTALSQIIKGKQGADQAIKPQKFGISVTASQKRNSNPDKTVDKPNAQKSSNSSNSQSREKQPRDEEFSNPIIVGESKQVRNLISRLK